MKPPFYTGIAACGFCLCLNMRAVNAQDIVKDAKSAATQASKTVKKAVQAVQRNGAKTVRTSASLAGKTAGTGLTVAGKAARVTRTQALKMAATPSWDTLKSAYDYQAGPPDDMKEEPADTDNAMVLKLTFTGCNGKPVEGIFMRPKEEGNYPVALLPHGLTNNKEIAVKMFGNALVAKGIAVLALDAPGHGHNEPPNKSYWNKQVITLAVHEGDRNYRRALDYLATRPDVDMDHVGLLGYSMGSIMGSILGSVDDRVKAFALCVGGDPFLPIAHATIDDGQRTTIMQVCPSLYIRHIPGHPIIMFNGLKDVVVVSPAAKILQVAAPKPNQVVWYDGGHDVPDAIRARAVAWLTKQLKPEGEAAPKEGDSKEGEKKDAARKEGDQKADGDQKKNDQNK
jgi:dienelactone hydrolase